MTMPSANSVTNKQSNRSTDKFVGPHQHKRKLTLGKSCIVQISSAESRFNKIKAFPVQLISIWIRFHRVVLIPVFNPNRFQTRIILVLACSFEDRAASLEIELRAVGFQLQASSRDSRASRFDPQSIRGVFVLGADVTCQPVSKWKAFPCPQGGCPWLPFSQSNLFDVGHPHFLK